MDQRILSDLNDVRKDYFFLIDLDGVLIDNVLFENKVLDEIVKVIAERSGTSHAKAAETLQNQINQPVEGRNRYRYDYQCKQLGLEDAVWQMAHEKSKENLSLFAETHRFLIGLQKIKSKRVCIVSDSTRWTLDFKLNYTKIANFISESYSQDETLAYKGQLSYWDKIFSEHQQRFDEYEKVFYLENRIDRIQTIKKWHPSIIGILVMQSEHLEQYKSKQKLGLIDYEVFNLSEALDVIERSVSLR